MRRMLFISVRYNVPVLQHPSSIHEQMVCMSNINPSPVDLELRPSRDLSLIDERKLY